MTDGESARHRRNTPNASRAELMTDGAIRCRLLLLKVRPLKCHSRFPTNAACLQAGCPGVGLRFSARWFPDQSSRAGGRLIDNPIPRG